MLNETEARLVNFVDDPTTISGILLYGSQTGFNSDSQSDVDLICVLSSPREFHRRELKPFEDVYLDIYYASRSMLEKRLRMPNQLNNNFILNGLIEGKALVDRDGALRDLSNTARAMWNRGPMLPSRRQAEFLQQQLNVSVYSLRKSLARAGESPEQEGLFRLRCSELFFRMVYEYCHRRGLWTNSMPRLLRWAQNNCHELYQVARQYLVAKSNEELLDSLMSLLGLLEKTLKLYPGLKTEVAP